MTEADAKMRWCPAARVTSWSGGSAPGANRLVASDGDTVICAPFSPCLASACMAWRWNRSVGPNTTPRGYCGLAGNPSAT